MEGGKVEIVTKYLFVLWVEGVQETRKNESGKWILVGLLNRVVSYQTDRPERGIKTS